MFPAVPKDRFRGRRESQKFRFQLRCMVPVSVLQDPETKPRVRAEKPQVGLWENRFIEQPRSYMRIPEKTGKGRARAPASPEVRIKHFALNRPLESVSMGGREDGLRKISDGDM